MRKQIILLPPPISLQVDLVWVPELELGADREIVVEAVKQNGLALQFAAAGAASTGERVLKRSREVF